MKRKYADYPNWDRVKEKRYINKYFNNKDFKGNISLLEAVKVKEKLVVGENKVVILDDGFQWLEVYPEDNKNIALSVCINNKDEKSGKSLYYDIRGKSDREFLNDFAENFYVKNTKYHYMAREEMSDYEMDEDIPDYAFEHIW